MFLLFFICCKNGFGALQKCIFAPNPFLRTFCSTKCSATHQQQIKNNKVKNNAKIYLVEKWPDAQHFVEQNVEQGNCSLFLQSQKREDCILTSIL